MIKISVAALVVSVAKERSKPQTQTKKKQVVFASLSLLLFSKQILSNEHPVSGARPESWKNVDPAIASHRL